MVVPLPYGDLFTYHFSSLIVQFFVWFIVFNATFNNIPVISWRSVLLVKETGVPRKKHWPVASHWQTWSHNVVSSTPHHEQGLKSRLGGDRHW